MNKSDFITYLTSASYHAVKLAESYVKNEMHYDFKYRVRLNQSCDHQVTEENDLYPGDAGKVVICNSIHEVVELLCRKEKVPEWIDINVKGVDKSYTLLELCCCGRYTGMYERMYYSERGQGPFGIKSPYLPADFDPESGKKFKLKKLQPEDMLS